ncbi:DUF5060 domain-containing protein [Chondrinema litorale]|uniref:DUF5060 domain-containing protein n=1 Tax=Chondrinema litorale TaxID=2994555 RepID=UPI00254282C6|nr:DUF5060 domain-containing protein [Chondrinema litorale]UZR96599.1 DUF5060 domain-containing protein [Chondrinema litorale]
MKYLIYFFIFTCLIACDNEFIEDNTDITPETEDRTEEEEVNPDYDNLEQWDRFELSFQAEVLTDPFSTPPLSGIFTHSDGEKMEINGFYDGDSTYRIRFMPTKSGVWTYELSSELDSINGVSGGINAISPSVENHGMVKVSNTYHFAYDDGSSYFPFGTTLYAWFYQGEEIENQTIESLQESSFNKVRMCVMPKFYDYCVNFPPEFPYEKNEAGDYDFDKINPAYFQDVENSIEELLELGIEADVILFHPYDYWGFSRMGTDANKKYLQYVIARFGAYRNVWWSMANEYQLLEDFTEEDWDELGQYVADNDPYEHLNSVHNAKRGFYDFSKSWVTHVSVQVEEVDEIMDWRDEYQKPVIADEVGYEGDIPFEWGDLSPNLLLDKFWIATTKGGYVSHGETYEDPNDVLWWAKGGKLKGETPERITFLQNIIEDYGYGLTGVSGDNYIAEGEGYILQYLGEDTPDTFTYDIPDDGTYQVDIIDTWNMEIESAGEFSNSVSIDLPDTQYLAIRIQKKSASS